MVVCFISDSPHLERRPLYWDGVLVTQSGNHKPGPYWYGDFCHKAETVLSLLDRLMFIMRISLSIRHPLGVIIRQTKTRYSQIIKYRDICKYLCITKIQNNDNVCSVMSNLHTSCHFKLFSKIGYTCRRGVVSFQHQTPQGQSVTKPGTYGIS